MNTVRRRLAIGCLALIASSSAALATDITSTVSAVWTDPGQHVAWFQTKNMPNQPSCASSQRWAFDLSTPQGQATYAALQTAFATGRNISVIGAGSCNTWSDSEDLGYIISR